MNSYINIKIISDMEIGLSFLRNKVYTKLHKAIFDLKANNIGISFPKSSKRLGDVIRIHSDKKSLETLQNLNWLGGLSGYCKISDILPVPTDVKGYQTISRIRQTMTDAKLKKRVEYQKQQGVLETDRDVQNYIRQYKTKMFKTGLDNPYLELQSTSTGNKYRIYIKFGDLHDEPMPGTFNYFGLSKQTTIPYF